MPYIYRIYVYLTKQSYIGQSMQDSKVVWQQAKSQLKRGKHRCKPLQEAAKMHGVHAIGFEVLTEGAAEDIVRLQREEMERRGKLCLNTRKPSSTPRGAHAGRPVVWEEISYPSIQAVVDATGLTRRQVQFRLEWGFTNEAEVIIDPFQPEWLSVEWEGVVYPSVAAGSRETNIPYKLLKKYRRMGIKTWAQANEHNAAMQREHKRMDDIARLRWLLGQQAKMAIQIEELRTKLATP